MKRLIIFTTIVLACGGPLFAQSMLKVSLTDRSLVTVSVDGRYFRKAGESVTVGDLPPGRHYVEIFASRPSARGGREMIWEGRVKTHEGVLTVCSVDPYSRDAITSDQDMPAPMTNQQPNDGGAYNNQGKYNYDTRGGANNTNNQENPPAENKETQNIPPETQENATPLPEGTPVASPVSIDEPVEKPSSKKAAKLTKLKTKADAKKTDTEKLEIIKAGLKNEKLSTAKVSTIMDWFSFEHTKAEFAKWAYPQVTDKDKFKTVKQKLTMKSYREDIDKFLREQL